MILRLNYNGNWETLQRQTLPSLGTKYKVLTIHAGEIAVVYASENVALSTLLGSCISICLCDVKNGAFAMNHFMVPSTYQNGSKNQALGAVYSMQEMLRVLENTMGCDIKRLKAKIAGGARTVATLKDDIGKKNAEAAIALCNRLGIEIISMDIGGMGGRKLINVNGLSTYVRSIMKTPDEIDVADAKDVS